MDYAAVAQELLRAARGKRSQRLLSKRLGYSSNVLYRWETGRSWPAAEDFFRLLDALGQNTSAQLVGFLKGWDARVSLQERDGVTELLQLAKGRKPIGELAEACDRSRFVVGRWLSGETAIRLPELLQFLELCTSRILEFIAVFVSPEKLPSVRERHRLLEASQRAAYDNPWSHAVLRVLELNPYAKLKRHRPGFIAQRLGIPQAEEERCLALLTEAGQITFDGQRYVVREVRTLNVRRIEEKHRQVRAFWIDVNRSRLMEGAPGVYGYNICSVSKVDHRRIVEAYLRFYQEFQQIASQSQNPEEVVLMTVQIAALDQVPAS